MFYPRGKYLENQILSSKYVIVGESLLLLLSLGGVYNVTNSCNFEVNGTYMVSMYIFLLVNTQRGLE